MSPHAPRSTIDGSVVSPKLGLNKILWQTVGLTNDAQEVLSNLPGEFNRDGVSDLCVLG